MRAGQLLAHAGDPVGGIVGICNARAEVRVFGGRRQRGMQFAQPRADHADEVDVAGQRLVGIHARFRDRHRRRFTIARGHAFHLHGQFVDGASQVVQCPRPGIALVGNEALHDGQRGAFAVGSVVRDFADECRRVGVAHAREVSRHLHLGVDARCDTADQLDDNGLANHQRAVRLLGRQPLDGRVGCQRQRRRPCAAGFRRPGRFGQLCDVRFRLEMHGAVIGFQRGAAHEVGEQRPGEGLGGEGVSQVADMAAAPHARQGELNGQSRQRGRFPCDGKRQQVALDALGAVGAAQRDGHFVEEHLGPRCPGQRAVGGCGIHRHGGAPGKLCATQHTVLGGKPAALGQIGWQDFAFDQLAVCLALSRIGQGIQPCAQHQRRELGQLLGSRLRPGRARLVLAQLQPIEGVGRQREQIRQLADGRKRRPANQLHRHPLRKGGQIQLHSLRGAGEVRHAQDRRFAFERADIRQHLAVGRLQKLDGTPAEHAMPLARGKQPARPVQQRMRVAALRFHVHRFIAVQRAHDGRQHELFGVGAREAAVAVGGPLHWRAHAVAVAEVDVVAHADFVAVIHDGRAGHGEEQAVHQLDAAAVAFQQRCQPAADAQVQARAAVACVDLPEVVALGIGHHFERQFVVIAQEDGPLAAGGHLRRLAHDVGDRKTVFTRDRHVHARHQRKVERHVAFVAGTEVFLRVFRPLVGLGQQQAVLEFPIHGRANLAQHFVCLGQVLVRRAFAFHEIRHGIEPQTIHAQIEPELHHADHCLEHARVVEVEIGLVRVEAVPVIGVGHRVPRPV